MHVPDILINGNQLVEHLLLITVSVNNKCTNEKKKKKRV
jgi:hypothetical protein